MSANPRVPIVDDEPDACTSLRRILRVVEFEVRLDELHNNSTTVTLTGKYDDAKKVQQLGELNVPAITWGHNKDHRPDLRKLLYIST